MNRTVRLITIPVIVLFLISCNYFTYTPKSRKNIKEEQPSIVLLSAIADFRIEQDRWPVSKEDFISKGKKYLDAFSGFRYNNTNFKIIDSNKMVFFFSDHVKDAEKYKETEQYDLNSYRGTVKYYKENGKFVWKLKMY
jgi:cbb3-type cytochrome oxidase subunit 3